MRTYIQKYLFRFFCPSSKKNPESSDDHTNKYFVYAVTRYNINEYDICMYIFKRLDRCCMGVIFTKY